MRVCVGLLLLLCLAAVPLAVAQEEIPPPANAGGAGDFAELTAKWKPLMERLRELQVEYQTASPARRAALEKEFNTLIKQGETLAPQMQAAAEAAYAADKENEEAAEFLISAAVQEYRSDNYEETARLTGLLIENDYSNKGVYDLAGVAAFELSDLKTAEKYFKVAEQEQVLGDQGQAYLAELDTANEKWAAEQNFRAAEAKADDLPRVLLKTNKGDITIELFENEAPQAVANFISLVEDGFYDGLTFHRVLPGFMAQGGDPKGDGSGGPGYNIRCECYQDNARTHYRGSLSMAHAGRDTGGSQFFLTFRPTTHLDGKHTVFGRVIEGMEVLNKLQRRDPDDPAAPDPDKIVKATVLRKRNHPYEPEKLPE